MANALQPISGKNGRRKRCKACGELFYPKNTLQQACSPSCALTFVQTPKGRSSIEKVRRSENRKAKQAAKSLSKLRAEAQAAFNAYIRERDRDAPCISCGRHHRGQYHAGHYRTVGAAPELRFDESNCHRQCAPCNNHLSGNLVEYRLNLVKKIGQEGVDYLEGPHKPKKYSRDDLIRIRDEYRAKVREMR